MPEAAPIPGPAGPTGAAGAAGAAGPQGPAGPAPAGTGLVSVTGGVLDTPLALAAGDIVIGGALGVPAVLAAGSAGYMLRMIGGAPVWRELSASGLLADRPAATAGREGQEYWSTDAAAGLELARCVHKGGGTYAWEVVSYGVTATGVAVAQAASEAAGRTALGLGTPTSLAAQARLATLLRRGPMAMRSTGSSGTASTGATSDATPDIALSTSGVAVVYAAQAGGYSGQVLAQSGVWATRGWYLTAQGSELRINLMQGSLITVDLASVVGTVGWHAVAWSLPADGLTVRYSVDGAAVTTATPSTTPLTAVSRAAGDTVYVATNGSGTGTTCGVAYLALWESILADGDLTTLSTAPSAGAPTLPSTPVWEWAAAAFAGVEAVTIDGVVHAITGTPQVWMP